MKPKDLKNSEELNAAQSGTEKPEETVDSKNKKTVDAEKEKQKSKKVTASNDENTPEKPDSETLVNETKPEENNTEEPEKEELVTEKPEETVDSKNKKTVDAEKEKQKSKKVTASNDENTPEKPDSETFVNETEPEENNTEEPEKEELVAEKPEEKEDRESASEKVASESDKLSKETQEISKTEKSNEIEVEKSGKETPEEIKDTEEKEVAKEEGKELNEAPKAKEEKTGKAIKKEESKPKKEKKEAVDYSKYTQVELINALRDVLDNHEDHYDVKAEIDAIKSSFYKIRTENVELAKAEFVKEGGMEEEFVAEEDPYENDIRDLLRRYKQIRIEHNKQLDQEKEGNLKKKYEVIEKIKGLINNEESINKTFNEFRELQNEWREIGLVPQSKMKNLWDLYHFHVENFYDYIKINRELRDLDLKKNLEMKINLCEHAEELLVEPSIIKAFGTLQKYHEQWREIGPVPHENKDDIWERFKTVTAKINKKHQEFFEGRKDEQRKNLEAKTALCEKVEEINSLEPENYKEWDEKSKEIIELQKVWRTIGFAPKKDNNKIYDRFRTACDEFFNKKRDFYSKNKELQQNNLQMKLDLCMQAEALKDSADWKKTTQDLINIQKQWKEIGPVPRKHSDTVWKRFRAACDYFFEKKSEHFSDVDTEQVDNLKLKEELIEEVKNFKSKGKVEENLKSLKEFQRRWTEIGHVPFKKKDDVQNRFREAVNNLYDDLNIDDDKRNLLKFKSKMASFSESNRGQNKMRFEREKYMNKLKQLENDLVLLDNNVGFFAKSKNAESLIADVKNKIELTKQKIETLKEKIRVIDDLDN